MVRPRKSEETLTITSPLNEDNQEPNVIKHRERTDLKPVKLIRNLKKSKPAVFQRIIHICNRKRKNMTIIFNRLCKIFR